MMGKEGMMLAVVKAMGKEGKRKEGMGKEGTMLAVAMGMCTEGMTLEQGQKADRKVRKWFAYCSMIEQYSGC